MREPQVRSEALRYGKASPQPLPRDRSRYHRDEAALRAVLRDLERKLPAFAKHLTRLIRHPPSLLVRIPLGLALIVGGIFSILPVLGIWMLPLGLLLLARDVPAVRRVSARMLRWIERKLPERT